jgi:hypothetical protein
MKKDSTKEVLEKQVWPTFKKVHHEGVYLKSTESKSSFKTIKPKEEFHETKSIEEGIQRNEFKVKVPR